MKLNHPIARLACMAGLASTLTLGGLAVPARAYAASAETEAELARLTREVNAATATYSEAMGQVSALQEEIDGLATEILAMEQETLPAQRERAKDAAVDMYKMQNDSASLLSSLLSSTSLSDFANLSRYLGVIEDTNVAELESLNALRAQLDRKLEAVSASKDEAERQQAAAAEALAKAQGAQRQMQAKAAAEDAAEAEAARKAAEEAAAKLAAAQEQHGGTPGGTGAGNGNGIEDDGASDDKESGSSSDSGSGNDGDSGNAGGNSGGSNSTSTSGWRSGVASHYGIGDGFLNKPTASGQLVTETSMGVAMLNVPLGTRVEIRFRGRTVIAVVNDRGPYAHGRVIDMQPAVARALGFVSVGVGTVEYRFL